MVLLPGAHMSAANTFGERRLLPADAAVLVVSRPGYGRTPLAAGPSAPEFAHRLAGLCRRLELTSVTTLGISMGARTALTLAAQQPALVVRRRAALPGQLRARGPTRAPARLALAMFNPVTQAATWAALHGLLRNRPDVDPARRGPQPDHAAAGTRHCAGWAVIWTISSVPGRLLLRPRVRSTTCGRPPT